MVLPKLYPNKLGILYYEYSLQKYNTSANFNFGIWKMNKKDIFIINWLKNTLFLTCNVKQIHTDLMRNSHRPKMVCGRDVGKHWPNIIRCLCIGISIALVKKPLVTITKIISENNFGKKMFLILQSTVLHIFYSLHQCSANHRKVKERLLWLANNIIIWFFVIKFSQAILFLLSFT